jgi:hypothetical protein
MATPSMQSKSANYRRCVLTIGLTRPDPSFLPGADGSSPCSGRSASLRDHPPKAVIGGRPRTAFQLLREVPRPRLRKNVLPCDAVCWDYPSYPVKRRQMVRFRTKSARTRDADVTPVYRKITARVLGILKSGGSASCGFGFELGNRRLLNAASAESILHSAAERGPKIRIKLDWYAAVQKLLSEFPTSR